MISEDDILNMDNIDFMIKVRKVLDKIQRPENKIDITEIKLSTSNLFLVKDLESRTKIRVEIVKDINKLMSNIY